MKSQKDVVPLMANAITIGERSFVGASSRFPSEIINDINSASSNLVVVYNGDIWRYRKELESITTDKKVFISTLGYNNFSYSNGVNEISFPVFYFTRTTTTDAFVPLKHNLPYGFSSLNNRFAIHRTLLGCRLLEEQLLGDIIYSQGLHDYTDFWETEFPETVPGNYVEFKQLLPFKTIDETGDFVLAHGVEHPAYTDAYCNIVTESETEDFPYTKNINLPIVTEKSYKPFFSKQIPVYLAARGHLTYLESLGFEMMRDFLPTGFDDLNTVDRINAIVDIVKRGKEYAEDFYFSHVAEIKHNYELVNSDKVDHLILDNIRNFVKNV